jgi:hypothetical protein
MIAAFTNQVSGEPGAAHWTQSFDKLRDLVAAQP